MTIGFPVLEAVGWTLPLTSFPPSPEVKSSILESMESIGYLR
jgi:hypothetical protein